LIPPGDRPVTDIYGKPEPDALLVDVVALGRRFNGNLPGKSSAAGNLC
jgi:hypothetical protein